MEVSKGIEYSSRGHAEEGELGVMVEPFDGLASTGGEQATYESSLVGLQTVAGSAPRSARWPSSSLSSLPAQHFQLSGRHPRLSSKRTASFPGIFDAWDALICGASFHLAWFSARMACEKS